MLTNRTLSASRGRRVGSGHRRGARRRTGGQNRGSWPISWLLRQRGSSAARRNSLPTSPKRLNLAVLPLVSPAMSCQTSTWASQLGPAPMPTVGTVSFAGDLGGQLRGHHLHHDRERTGLGDGDRVVDGLLGGVAAALDPEAAQAVDALRGEADVAITGMPAAVRVAICSATRSPPSSLTACAPVSFEEPRGRRECLGRGPPRSCRTAGRPPPARARRRAPRRGPAGSVRRPRSARWCRSRRPRWRRIADQQNRDAGLVEGAGGGEVVGRQHGPLVALGLPLQQVMVRTLVRVGGRRRAPPTVNSLFRHRCLP